MPLTGAERQKRHRERQRALIKGKDQNALVEKLRKRCLLLEKKLRKLDPNNSHNVGEFLLGQLNSGCDVLIASTLCEMVIGPRDQWSDSVRQWFSNKLNAAK